MNAHLLLIEDNDMLGSSLVDNFQMENYSIDWIQSGTEGLDVASQGLHDLIILDIMLPHMNGFDVLKNVREKSNIPVVILSSKALVDDRIKGLELKADDYISKPFQFKELLLRVQNILRRQAPAALDLQQISIGKANFDFGSLSVKSQSTQEKLSEKEAGLLRLLIAHTNQVVSREKILNTVWGAHNYPSTRTIDNFIVKLRRWIEIDPSQPQFIISHRGIGYSLNKKDP